VADYRLHVGQVPVEDAPPWLAVLRPANGDGEVIRVGRFDSQREAVTRGCTALRFVAAGIPWRGDR
jgi:hypothetical protein